MQNTNLNNINPEATLDEYYGDEYTRMDFPDINDLREFITERNAASTPSTSLSSLLSSPSKIISAAYSISEHEITHSTFNQSFYAPGESSIWYPLFGIPFNWLQFFPTLTQVEGYDALQHRKESFNSSAHSRQLTGTEKCKMIDKMWSPIRKSQIKLFNPAALSVVHQDAEMMMMDTDENTSSNNDYLDGPFQMEDENQFHPIQHNVNVCALLPDDISFYERNCLHKCSMCNTPFHDQSSAIRSTRSSSDDDFDYQHGHKIAKVLPIALFSCKCVRHVSRVDKTEPVFRGCIICVGCAWKMITNSLTWTEPDNIERIRGITSEEGGGCCYDTLQNFEKRVAEINKNQTLHREESLHNITFTDDKPIRTSLDDIIESTYGGVSTMMMMTSIPSIPTTNDQENTPFEYLYHNFLFRKWCCPYDNEVVIEPNDSFQRQRLAYNQNITSCSYQDSMYQNESIRTKFMYFAALFSAETGQKDVKKMYDECGISIDIIMMAYRIFSLYDLWGYPLLYNYFVKESASAPEQKKEITCVESLAITIAQLKMIEDYKKKTSNRYKIYCNPFSNFIWKPKTQEIPIILF
jgi:hypothetical protein